MSKYKQVKINLTNEHHLELLEKANSEKTTIAQYIRDQLKIDLSIKPRKRKRRIDDATFNKADPKLIYQISKIGNNLNQIAKAVNQKKDINVLKSLVNIETDLKKLL